MNIRIWLLTTVLASSAAVAMMLEKDGTQIDDLCQRMCQTSKKSSPNTNFPDNSVDKWQAKTCPQPVCPQPVCPRQPPIPPCPQCPSSCPTNITCDLGQCPEPVCPTPKCPSPRCPTPVCPEPQCPELQCPAVPKIPPCPAPVCPEPQCPQANCPQPICPKPTCPPPICPQLPDVRSCPECPSSPPQSGCLRPSCPPAICPPRRPCPVCPKLSANPTCPPCPSASCPSPLPLSSGSIPQCRGCLWKVLVTYDHFPGFGFYKAYNEKLTWHQANTTCVNEGGHLGIINNEDEADIFRLLFQKSNMHGWIFVGFHDLYEEKKFMTVLDEPLRKSGYVNWLNGQPDNLGNEDCGTIEYRAYLNDGKCDWKVGYICEVPESKVLG